MYTYKFTKNSKDIKYGPNCHNYSTACLLAKEFVDSLLQNGWTMSSAYNDFIYEPYDFILFKNQNVGRVAIGRISS